MALTTACILELNKTYKPKLTENASKLNYNAFRSFLIQAPPHAGLSGIDGVFINKVYTASTVFMKPGVYMNIIYSF